MNSSAVGTARVKRGMAEMLKGGVIMDVVTPDQAKIAEDAGAVAVMALERVPAQIRKEGGVARSADPSKIEAIKRAVESGLGIGCISRLALRDAFRRGSLVAVETPDLDLARQFYFIWHKQKYQTSAMREFLDLCRAFTAGVQRSDEIVLPTIA